MPWWDYYKLWTYSFEDDPIARRRKRKRAVSGAGVVLPDAIPDIRQDGSFWGGGRGLIRLHDSNDFIDLSSITNRQSRYKEYDRLLNIAEIDTAITVFADESCVAGSTLIATLFDGFLPIKTLVDRWKLKQEDFLVYCWDFEKNDYTLGWAYDPRLVKTAKTMKIGLDDGSYFICTPDHRILLASRRWIVAGELKYGDQLMPFYRLQPNIYHNDLKIKQFPRIFTFNDGWKHQNQIINEWRLGKSEGRYERLNRACRMATEGLTAREIAKLMGHQWKSIERWFHEEGFTFKELKHLGSLEKVRRVISVSPHEEMEVFDMSVRDHENFCTDWGVMHNCQKNDKGNIFEIECSNADIAEDLNFLFFHREMLNLNRNGWKIAKKTYSMGDYFAELIIDPDEPKKGIVRMMELPVESVYRIETTKGRLVEFQQGKEGPDYDALTRAPITQATDAELIQQKAIRFTPEEIIHFKIGDDRKDFYPYGRSLIEPARGPAHQLRMMEDAMLVYRLTRAPERRVFYIDVGQLPPFKAEAFMERMKDQFRKKKVTSGRGGEGASAVDEKWHAPAADEDYWIPIRPNANTRIETLPGAQNLGEIDDALYFRNKVLIALNFPLNYLSNSDPNTTRIALSAQDVRFARTVERLQAHLEDGFLEIAIRHLHLKGYPEEAYEDLKIKMTPPSDWRELSKAEVTTNRINNANGLKGSLLMSDYDIYTKWLKYPEVEAQEMLARIKIQKLEDLKLQVLAQNPQLLGIGVPGGQGEAEMGTETGGPAPMLAPDQAGTSPTPPGGAPGMPPMPPPSLDGEQQGPPKKSGITLPDPDPKDIKKFDLEIISHEEEQDREEIDFSNM